MRDNDSGSEQRSGWEPPEYVSPWAPASSAARASEDAEPGSGTPDAGNTVPLGQRSAPEPGPAAGGYDQPAGYGGGPGVGYGQPAGGYGPPSGGYAQPSGFGQPAGSYGPPGGGYDQPTGGFGQPGFGQPGFGQPAGGGWNGGSGQDPWGFGYGTPPPPQGGGGLRRLLVYAAVAVLAAGAGAGVAIELGHSSANSSALGSGSQGNSGLGQGNGVGGNSGSNPFGGLGSGSSSGGTNTGSGSLNATSIAGKVDPGVVDIDSTLQYNQDDAEGTGMVISSSGLVLTNNHVIDEATSISVTEVTTGKSYPAKVVGFDSSDDVAVLQMEASGGGSVSGLTTVNLGNSSKVQLGDSVLAIGNAEGRGGLPATAQGIINATNRNITASDSGTGSTESLTGMLQTNAPIQEGDSGGPLVNSSAAVIGMDTAANSSGGFEGQSATTGFAIPINHAISIAHEIIAGDASATVHIGEAGFIGIGTCASNSGNGAGGASGAGNGSGSSAPNVKGAYVCEVYQNTPAFSAGLQEGDVITAVDGTSITSADGLSNYLFSKHPGDKLTITYTDQSGASHTTSLTLASLAK
ncbi:MAG TPA: trypsin-like peptidase domain-containing protein [Trebonia sp.]|nr:trypsin-like peptidase domain-containing protein [Trebonia sp.]